MIREELRYRRDQLHYLREWLYWLYLPAWPGWLMRRAASVARRHPWYVCAVLVVGLVGLTQHVWLGFLLVGGLARDVRDAVARQTPAYRAARLNRWSKRRNTTGHYE